MVHQGMTITKPANFHILVIAPFYGSVYTVEHERDTEAGHSPAAWRSGQAAVNVRINTSP